MNKIYKTIWNKAKRCLSAVSELAKSHSGGGTVVKTTGGAKGKRGRVALDKAGQLSGSLWVPRYLAALLRTGTVHGVARPIRMAAVTLGVTASLVSFGSNVARADSITISDASNPNGGNNMTLSSDGNFVWYPSDSSVTQLNIKGGYGSDNSFAGYYSGSFDDDDGNNVSDHTVNISGGTVRSVYGGFVQNGDVKNNIVTFTGGSAERIDGGHINYNASSRVVSGNVVTLDGNGAIIRESSYSSGVRGGYNWGEGAATGNRVEIKNGATVNNTVFGGYTYSGAAGGTTAEEGNKVIISSGTVSEGVYGGFVFSGTGTAGYNSVEISGGTVGSYVYGGYSESGNATGNTVNISQSDSNIPTSITGTVYGGYSYKNAGGTGEGEGNTVNITGGMVEGNVYNDAVYGGYSEGGKATGNTVNMTGGTVKGDLYGGTSASSDATGNKVNITGGTARDVYGGSAEAGGSGNATGNTVSISGGTVRYVYGGSNYNGNATGNTVTISGGMVQNDVLGGYSDSGNATGNTVILSKQKGKDAPVLNGTVYGGYSFEERDAVTGNTLQVAAAGLSAKGIQNFETIRLAGTLAWENGATVFKANQFRTNADGTRASLDVTEATEDGSEFVKTATDGQMTLLASDTAEDFKTLSLVYSGGTEALNETNLSKVVKTGEETTEAAPVNGVTVSSISTHTVSLDENSYKNVLYAVENMATKLTLGEMAWGTGRDLAGKYTFDDSVPIDAANLTFTGAATTALKKGDSATLVSNATGITADNEVAQPTGDAGKTVAVDYTDAAGIRFAATASGHVAAAADAVNYVVDGVTLNSVNLADWNGTTSSVPESWTAGGVNSGTASGVTVETEDPVGGGLTVETDGMTVPEVEAGKHIDILQSGSDNYFANATINGANAYKTTAFTESDPAEIVTIAGSQGKGVKAEGKNLVYALGTKDVDTVTLGKADFAKDAVLFDRSGAGYNYAKVKALGTDKFAISYDKPETVAAGDTMTLLKANKTLADMAAQTKTNSYEYEPVAGVKVNATVTGSLAAKGGAVTYRAEENRAGKLTFTNVDWKDSGALLTRPSNIVFAGADVDTAKIHFKNIESLEANKKMTLVSDFGDSVGTITGSKYMVGTAYEGEGKASLQGSDLIFMTDTEAGGGGPHLAEQTHAAVMTMEASLAMLAAGNDFIMNAQEGLQNTSVYASLGGATSRYKTGSHVNANTWNAIVAVGGKKGFEAGTLNLGVFAEYGEGNYKLHGSNVGGHGDAHYAGGGLLAKWTDPSNWYTEAGIRLGRLSNDANGILHDGAGRRYGYDKHSTYYGAHIGIGKVIEVDKGRSLDVYGKYFYTNYDGMNFHAGDDRYKLDDVTSSVVRTGLRFASTDKTWNWYGGLAYEYEFDGEAKGKVNGDSVKSAEIQGSSLRGEFGLKMDSTDTCPWKADIGVYGYTGKHRGVGGNVSIVYLF